MTDHRLRLYGYHRDTNPNLDGSAEQSFVYVRASASSVQVAPAHASLVSVPHCRRAGPDAC